MQCVRSSRYWWRRLLNHKEKCFFANFESEQLLWLASLVSKGLSSLTGLLTLWKVSMKRWFFICPRHLFPMLIWAFVLIGQCNYHYSPNVNGSWAEDSCFVKLLGLTWNALKLQSQQTLVGIYWSSQKGKRVYKTRVCKWHLASTESAYGMKW